MDNKIIKAAKFIRKMSNKKNDNEDRRVRAESVVRNHVIWSMGAGLIPIPVADFVAVAAVQLDMVRTLSSTYGIDFRETEGKALITSLTGSGLSRMGANALVKLIPGFGSVLGGVSMSIVSGASTYALGQVFKSHFEYGGTFLDFDTDRFQRYYDEQFEKGKTVAKDWKEEQEQEKEDTKAPETKPQKEATPTPETTANPQTPPTPPKQEDNTAIIIKKLKDLGELKDMGVLTEEEFTQMKAQLIKNYQ
jgi:uncharacterized protein (DUF697 family)